MMRVMGAVVALLVSAAAMAAPVEDTFRSSCAVCHVAGVAGAPKSGDKAAWAPRLQKGLDVLVENTRKGVGGMPPRGMCATCTDDDFRALIEYMTK